MKNIFEEAKENSGKEHNDGHQGLATGIQVD